MAANKVGKTYAGSMECAFHLTGIYPKWWRGLRFNKPIRMWAAGQTSETTRDTVQTMLMGPLEPYGTGSIPKDNIIEWSNARSSLAGTIDRALIKNIHSETEPSILQFKGYVQGVGKWFGPNVDFVWFDEEPDPPEIYFEGLMRTAEVGGSAMMTYTPLYGPTPLTKKFYPEPDTEYRFMQQMELEDADHFANDPEKLAAVKAGIPDHEMEARSRGIPMLGGGAIFTTPEDQIREDPFKIPAEWPRLGGIDFGHGGKDGHPTVAMWAAYDTEQKTLHVYDCLTGREADSEVGVFTMRMLERGSRGMPWAWPKDGLNMNSQTMVPLAEAFRRRGVNMLPVHAQFESGGYGVEAGIAVMHSMLQSGKLKIFSTCLEFFNEYRGYHRKDGKVYKLDDDHIDAVRHIVMMLRCARVSSSRRTPQFIDTDNYNPIEMGGRLWN